MFYSTHLHICDHCVSQFSQFTSTIVAAIFVCRATTILQGDNHHGDHHDDDDDVMILIMWKQLGAIGAIDAIGMMLLLAASLVPVIRARDVDEINWITVNCCSLVIQLLL